MKQGTVGMKLAAGEQVLTKTGRVTTPFPKIDITTNRKAINTVKRVDEWLIQNTLDEMIARKDEFNALIFRNATFISPADKDCAEEYLFGRIGTEIETNCPDSQDHKVDLDESGQKSGQTVVIR